MSARTLFFSDGKPRALWRVLLFSLLTIASVWLLVELTALLVPETLAEFWQLVIQNGVMLAGILIASAVMMRGIERRPVAALGLPLGPDLWKGLFAGFAIGAAFMGALVALQTLIGWFRPVPAPGTLSAWSEYVSGLALLLLVAAAAEELLFRGYAFQVLVEGMGVTPAVIVTSVIFAAGHWFNPEVGAVALLNIALAGVIMAVAYLRTRSLWVAIGLHWAWNWVMSAVFDLPVSGIEFDVPGYDTRELGPDLFTGGAFGPEGGLLTTALALVLLVWLGRTPLLRETARMAGLRPLVDERMGKGAG